MSKVVSQIFISANAMNDSVFAVIVPDKEHLLKTLFEIEGKITRAEQLKSHKQYQEFLETNENARFIMMQQLRQKEEEYALLE